MNSIKIYVASSWRNPYQPIVVSMLRWAGFEVYDFKDPAGGTGFAWSDIDPHWLSWNANQFSEALRHPIAQAGFRSDYGAMAECDACVLVLPCGRSAHVEAGWFAGSRKFTAALLIGQNEPELMYRMFNLVTPEVTTVIIRLRERFNMPGTLLFTSPQFFRLEDKLAAAAASAVPAGEDPRARGGAQ